MKIVVLDGRAVNPGDLSWDSFRLLGELRVYEYTEKEDIFEHAQGADILLTNKTPINAELIEKLPQLKYIGVLATGYNVVDTKAARSRGIPITNIPSYCTAGVAQMIFALLLELCNHVSLHNASVQRGEWQKSKDFSYFKAPLIELEGKTMGIIGFGNIGQSVAKIALAMGMKVKAYSRTVKYTGNPGIKWVSLEEIFGESDVLSLNCPLTAETERLINRQSLALMKPSALLINTSRGGVIAEEDLAAALNAGIIAGAGLDVLATEPPAKGSPLIGARNCIITPHIAWASKAARERLIQSAAQNIKSFLNGKTQNVVN
ncbi:MAG: D-2-hydroxyacid dehydrogenase [Oscillospiraceae bacterium]|nr:D-2-hydroxyacid dehydrogenase [Oscillospiraceae bacterium]